MNFSKSLSDFCSCIGKSITIHVKIIFFYFGNYILTVFADEIFPLNFTIINSDNFVFPAAKNSAFADFFVFKEFTLTFSTFNSEHNIKILLPKYRELNFLQSYYILL